jgi:hypothetical protein
MGEYSYGLCIGYTLDNDALSCFSPVTHRGGSIEDCA